MTGHNPLNDQNNHHVNSTDEEKQHDNESFDTNDKPALDQEWLSMSEDWQTQPYEKVNVATLLAQTKRRTYWAKTLLAIDIIATLAVIMAFFIGLYKGDWGHALMLYLGIAVVISIFFVYIEIKIRLTTWKGDYKSPEQAIEVAISGCRSSIQYIKLIKLSLLPYIIIAPWFVIEMAEQTNKPVWKSIVLISVVFITTYVICNKFLRKRRQELKQLESNLYE
jgi:hypothetical protein